MSILIPIMLVLFPVAILVCVGAVIMSEFQKAPADSADPTVEFGGTRGRLDLIPIPGSSRALASPLAEPSFSPAKVTASGRGHHHRDHYANDVAATITHDRVTVDIDQNNRARIHRIRRLRADGRGV